MKKKRTGKRASKSFNRSVKWNGEWQKVGQKNHHHDLAKSRGGRYTEANIYFWDISVHRAFHFLFENKTLLEAAQILVYIHEQKQQGKTVDILGN